MQKKKILFFQWHSFMNQGIERALQKLDISYECFFYQFSDWEKDDVFCEKFKEKLLRDAYTLVFSVNYSPLISQICEELGMKYISWVYDSPLHIRNLESLKNSCNEIYFFDRGQAEEFYSAGVNAKHMPLAVDMELFGKIVQQASKDCQDKAVRKAEISMVGQLYQTEYNHFAAPMDGYLRGYLEGIINAQMKVYGGYLIPELITEDLLGKMNEIYKNIASDGFQMGRRELEYLLAQEVTGRERYLALALLSGRFPVDVYTKDVDNRLENITFCGYADYNTKMPAIFANSKINLNISLKTIRTGIPLRVIDIMGCGGFVISNYQQELAEYFRIGEECEVYENLEDLVLKADFYLRNDALREKIAVNAWERVKRDFTFEERIRKIFEKQSICFMD